MSRADRLDAEAAALIDAVAAINPNDVSLDGYMRRQRLRERLQSYTLHDALGIAVSCAYEAAEAQQRAGQRLSLDDDLLQDIQRMGAA